MNAQLKDDYILTTPRETQDRARQIRLHPSGLYVNPLALRAKDVQIEDIAHHLANICRYTGASPEHYSVAQHCFLVSEQLEQQYPCDHDLHLAGLLHDAGEYVFNDIASPVKRDPRMQWYVDLEHEATKMIFCVFGLRPELLARTKRADDGIFQREAATWWGGSFAIQPWQPRVAERVFLKRFEQLQGRRRREGLT